ncbi:MAG TPA: hypothetical protein ENK88_04915 [Campylobacterales bacterium]|nr:hypothetical protein [Campylobacterales bacterium]
MWLKTVATTAVILGITACGGSKTDKKTEILEVNKVFQGEIPEMYQSCHNAEVNELFGMHTVYILLPETIETHTPLTVDIYGCWIGENYASYISIFDGLETKELNPNKIELTLKKIDNTGGTVSAQDESFRKWHSYDINGSWHNDELEVIVQNPDNKNLNALIIVD